MKVTIKLEINSLDEIDKVLDLSKVIFQPNPEEERRYHDKNNWLAKIQNGGLLLTAKDKENIVGFTLCYPNGDKFHIWNVGVAEAYRRLGVWKEMYRQIVDYAQKNKFKEITLNTFETKFPQMYSFCAKNGFEEYKVEGRKSFFVKAI